MSRGWLVGILLPGAPKALEGTRLPGRSRPQAVYQSQRHHALDAHMSAAYLKSSISVSLPVQGLAGPGVRVHGCMAANCGRRKAQAQFGSTSQLFVQGERASHRWEGKARAIGPPCQCLHTNVWSHRWPPLHPAHRLHKFQLNSPGTG
jgi:hypothetical protein